LQLDLTDEQRMLAETLADLLEKRCDPNARLKLLRSETGWSRQLWAHYAELGLLGLPFEERYGGAGRGAAELAVVMEQFGRALALEPYLSTVLLAGSLVARVGSEQQKAEVLPRLVNGELLLAFAGEEREARWSLTDVATTAAPSRSGWAIRGQKTGVLGGDSADCLVVTARTPDGEIGLFLVDVGAARDAVRCDPYRFQDGTRGADVRFGDAPATPLGSPTAAAMAVDEVITQAMALRCAEAVGAMDRMVWSTVDYLKTREQFGHPIAAFQALQHRAADMYIALEEARGMALLARLALAVEDPAEQRRTVQACRVKIDTAARMIGQEAIQLHGGIGMTAEYPVGHYLKRLTVISKTFADTDTLVEALAAAGGLVTGEV
jgi:alkylation response protein AidB-like acyl-CoA dehydrogenase